jgi:hypothetical protein
MIQSERRAPDGIIIVIENTEIQDTTFPPTNTPTADHVHEPSPIDAITHFAANLANPVQETTFDFVRQKLDQLWN